MLLALNSMRDELATRPGIPDNAIEGASLIRHGSSYYLFISVDHCCAAASTDDNYKQAVGRSSSPHGPFVDSAGTPMKGGGTVLLQGNAAWNAPGGGTAYIDSESGDDLLIFHAQNLANGAIPYAWVKKLQWNNGRPGITE